MGKRLAYDAPEDVAAVLAEHGSLGYRSRNAMINAAVLELAERRRLGVPDGTNQYREFVEKLYHDVEQVPGPRAVELATILGYVVDRQEVPKVAPKMERSTLKTAKVCATIPPRVAAAPEHVPKGTTEEF